MSNPFIVENSDGRSIEINPESLDELDIIKKGAQEWQLLDNGQSYSVSLLSFDYPNRKISLSVNGEQFDLTIQDRYAQLIEQMGLSKDIVIEVKDIKAPMPGLVLKTFLKEGDAFAKGDSLLILEAMKMENIIKAPTDGVITKVNIKEGESVEKGQVLLEL